MKRIMLIGRSGSGKTTLSQALQGKKIEYEKTQYIKYVDMVIDTPGEYAESRKLGRALALYAYEADIVGVLIAADELYTRFAPNLTCMTNRETIGIISKIHSPNARPKLVESWLRLVGCKKIFYVDSPTGEGVGTLLKYLQK